jgi:hypothetical protein
MFSCGNSSGRWLGVVVIGGLKTEASTRMRTELRAPLTLHATVEDMCVCSNIELQSFFRALISGHVPVPSQLAYCDSAAHLPQYCSAAAAKSLAVLLSSVDTTAVSWLAGLHGASAGPYTAYVALTIPHFSLPAFEFVSSQSMLKFWALFTLPDGWTAVGWRLWCCPTTRRIRLCFHH